MCYSSQRPPGSLVTPVRHLLTASAKPARHSHCQGGTNLTIRVPPPPARGRWPISAASSPSAINKLRRPAKSVTAALSSIVVLALIVGMTLYLAAPPKVTMHAVVNEVATKLYGQTGTYFDSPNQPLNQIFAPMCR